MAQVFITGSSAGLGLMAGELLVEKGHQVALHARNQTRGDDAEQALPQAQFIVIGDIDTIAASKGVANTQPVSSHRRLACL
jgi:NADP-dependent 3-hydroxy acid dehydrogenase YdfG